MRFRVGALVCLMISLAAAALGQCTAPASGYVEVCGSALSDSTGTPISNATISFQPTDNYGNKISYKISGHGQSISWASTAQVSSGAFQIKLADTALTSPANVCYAVTVTDNTTGKTQLSSGYTCVQPAGSGVAVSGSQAWCTAASGGSGGTCNFDNYTPNFTAGVVVQTGPAGPPGAAGTLNSRGNWAPSTSYAAADMYVEGGTTYVVNSAYTSGSSFGSTDTSHSSIIGQYSGVSSDGSNGLSALGGFTANTQYTYPDASKQVSAAYNTQAVIISPNCPTSSSRCIKIYADGGLVKDATTNSTTTVTCPDCAFTSADVGKIAWATTNANNGIFTTFVCPQTTIASVTNSTTVVLAAACTVTSSGNVYFHWGHDDGATLAGAYSAIGCGVASIGTDGIHNIMIGQGFGQTASWACTQTLTGIMGAPRPSIIGDGFFGSQTTFDMLPNFNWASCTGTADSGGRTVCIGSYIRSISNTQIYGSGLTPASNSNCANATGHVVLNNAGSGNMGGVDLAGICPGEANLGGIEVSGQDNLMDEGGAQDVGQYACIFSAVEAESGRGNDCHNFQAGAGNYGLYVTGGAKVFIYGSYPIQSTLIDGNSMIVSTSTSFIANTGATSAIEVTSGSSLYSYGDRIAGNGNTGLLVDSGAYAYMNGTSHTGTPPVNVAGTLVSTSSTYAGATVTGLFQSNGGNKFTAIPAAPTGSGRYSGAGVLSGSCRGAATSSSTLGLYGMGQYSTYACTSTTTTAGVQVQQVPLSGSVFDLACNATHAGVNASSGVVTVLKNGSATTLTCTIGTGTSCADNAHFDIPTAGDMYSIQFTTQASEVLAGVTCTVLAF